MTTTRETAAILALLRRKDVRARDVADLVQDHGSAIVALEYVVASPEGATQRLFPIDPGGSDQAADIGEIEAEVRAWEAEGIVITTILDPEYPENLHTVHDRPPLLFVHGVLLPSDSRSVAVVGTRKPSPEGVARASEMSAEMAKAGYVVVSGLAAGVDTAAHRAALAGGGRTVAVIGTGLRHAYPRENAGLQRSLGDTNAVVSQFLPDQGPRRWSFPARNAVMSGFARATVVIEASSTSGARTQARLALEHGRPVFLLSGLLEHAWARAHAERPGSHVVDCAQQVLEILEREYVNDFALTS
jgi:DNA processing protein